MEKSIKNGASAENPKGSPVGMQKRVARLILDGIPEEKKSKVVAVRIPEGYPKRILSELPGGI